MSNAYHSAGNGVDGPQQKDFENGRDGTGAGSCCTADNLPGYHLDKDMDPEQALRKIRTTGSLSISPELFEKIYLSPQNKVAGELRKTFGNPTPLYALHPPWVFPQNSHLLIIHPELSPASYSP